VTGLRRTYVIMVENVGDKDGWFRIKGKVREIKKRSEIEMKSDTN
jgi:hypothetical protein